MISREGKAAGPVQVLERADSKGGCGGELIAVFNLLSSGTPRGWGRRFAAVVV